jgi:methylenetetrahydrofolate dehydrogenase (NADP+) / methenyltetrahydrofolate cyclohydrolase
MIYTNTQLKRTFKKYLKSKFDRLDQKCVLNIVQIGDITSSTKYVNTKKKIGEEIGVEVQHHHFDESISESELQKLLDKAKNNKEGFIFQLPLPDKFNYLVPKTPLESDVDLLSENATLLWDNDFLPPTIGAIDLILKEMIMRKEAGETEKDDFFEKVDLDNFFDSKLNLRGKTVASIGQGILVGNPLLRYLRERAATIISTNSSTPNVANLLQNAQIVLSGVGKPNITDVSWLNPDAIVIDAATAGVNGALVGDVDKERINSKTYLCPSPGGVGPITVLYIFWNLYRMLKK